MTPLRLFFDTLTCRSSLPTTATFRSAIIRSGYARIHHRRPILLVLSSFIFYAFVHYTDLFIYILTVPRSCKHHFLIVHTGRCPVFSVADSLKIPTVDNTIQRWTTFCYKIATAYNMQRCSIVKLSSRTIFNNVPNENYVSR